MPVVLTPAQLAVRQQWDPNYGLQKPILPPGTKQTERLIVQSDVDLKKFGAAHARKKAYERGPTDDPYFNVELWQERYEKDPRFKKFPNKKKIERRKFFYDTYVAPFAKTAEEARELEIPFKPLGTAESVMKGFASGLEFLNRPQMRPGSVGYADASKELVEETLAPMRIERKMRAAERAGQEYIPTEEETAVIKESYLSSLQTAKPVPQLLGNLAQMGLLLGTTGKLTSVGLRAAGLKAPQVLAQAAGKRAFKELMYRGIYKALHGAGTFGLAELPRMATGEVTPVQALRHTAAATMAFGVGPGKILSKHSGRVLGSALGAGFETLTTPKEELKLYGSPLEVAVPSFVQFLGTRYVFEAGLPEALKASGWAARKSAGYIGKKLTHGSNAPSESFINLAPGRTKPEYYAWDPVKTLRDKLERDEVLGPLVDQRELKTKIFDVVDKAKSNIPVPPNQDVSSVATQLVAETRTAKSLIQTATKQMRADLIEEIDVAYRKIIPEGTLVEEANAPAGFEGSKRPISHGEYLEQLDNWHRTVARVTAELMKGDPNINLSFTGRAFLTEEGHKGLDDLMDSKSLDPFTQRVILALNHSQDINLYELEQLSGDRVITNLTQGGTRSDPSPKAEYLAKLLTKGPEGHSILEGSGRSIDEVVEIIDTLLHRNWLAVGTPELRTAAQMAVEQTKGSRSAPPIQIGTVPDDPVTVRRTTRERRAPDTEAELPVKDATVESILAGDRLTYPDGKTLEVVSVSPDTVEVQATGSKEVTSINKTELQKEFVPTPAGDTLIKVARMQSVPGQILRKSETTTESVQKEKIVHRQLPNWFAAQRTKIENNTALSPEEKKFFINLLNSKLKIPAAPVRKTNTPPTDLPMEDDLAVARLRQHINLHTPNGVSREEVFQFFEERYAKHRVYFDPPNAWSRVLRELAAMDLEHVDPQNTIRALRTRMHLAAQGVYPDDQLSLPNTPLEEQGFNVTTLSDRAGLALRIKHTSLAGRVVSPIELAEVVRNKGYRGYVEARTGDIYIEDLKATPKGAKSTDELVYMKITPEALDKLPSPGDFLGHAVRGLDLVVDTGEGGKFYVTHNAKTGKYYHHPKDAKAVKRYNGTRALTRQEINDLYLNNKGVIIESVLPEGLARVRVMGTGEVKNISLQDLKKLPNKKVKDLTPGINLPTAPGSVSAVGQRSLPTDGIPPPGVDPKLDAKQRAKRKRELEEAIDDQRRDNLNSFSKSGMLTDLNEGRVPETWSEEKPSWLPEDLTPLEQRLLEDRANSIADLQEALTARKTLQTSVKSWGKKYKTPLEFIEVLQPMPKKPPEGASPEVISAYEARVKDVMRRREKRVKLTTEAGVAIGQQEGQVHGYDTIIDGTINRIKGIENELINAINERKGSKGGTTLGFMGGGHKPKWPWDEERNYRPFGMTLKRMKNATEILSLMPRKSVFAKIQTLWRVGTYDAYRLVEEASEKTREWLFVTRPPLIKIMESLQGKNLDGLLQYLKNDPVQYPTREKTLREFHQLTKEELDLVPAIAGLLKHSLGPEWRDIINNDFAEYAPNKVANSRLSLWMEKGGLNPEPKDLLEILPNVVYSRARLQMAPELERIDELIRWLKKVPIVPQPKTKIEIQDVINEGDAFNQVYPEKYVPNGRYIGPLAVGEARWEPGKPRGTMSGEPQGTLGVSEPKYAPGMSKRVQGVQKTVPTTAEEQFFIPSKQRQRIIQELAKYRAQVTFSMNGDREAVTRFLEKMFEANDLDLDYRLFNKIVPRYLLLTYAATLPFRLGLVLKQVSQPFFTTMLYSGARNFHRGLAHAHSKTGQYQLNGAELAEVCGIHEVQSIPQEHLLMGELPSKSISAKAEFELRKLFEVGMRLFNRGDIWNRQVSASTGYTAMHEFGDLYLKGKISDTELLNETGLVYLERPTQNEVLALLSGGSKDSLEAAARLFGKHLAQDTQYLYHAGNTPGIFNSVTGKLLGQFGTWPTNHVRFIQRGVYNGNAQSRFSFLKRYTIANAVAATISAEFLGIDSSSWMFFGPLAYAGGPGTSLLTSLHLMARGGYYGDIGREMFKQNLLTLIPGSSAVKDVLHLFDEDEEDVSKRVIRAIGMWPTYED